MAGPLLRSIARCASLSQPAIEVGCLGGCSMANRGVQWPSAAWSRLPSSASSFRHYATSRNESASSGTQQIPNTNVGGAGPSFGAGSQQGAGSPVSSAGAGPSTGSHQIPNTNVGTSEQENAEPAFDGPPKLVVFGGNGYVGSHVCQEALKTGLAVVSVNRSGPPRGAGSWSRDIDWHQADAFQPDQWRRQLRGAIGIVSTLGAFGSNETMLKMCGEVNVLVFREAAAAGVQRGAFISVHDYDFPEFVLPGYFRGKRSAEAALAECFPGAGVALRPGFIHGTRQVAGVGVPLGALGFPLEKVLGYLPAKSLANLPLAGAAFVPPVSVQTVARAAVAAATDPSVPAGIMDIWQLHNFDKQ